MQSDEHTKELAAANQALRAKIAEHERTEQFLRESENKYRALVNEINDGLFVVDAQGVITFANRSLAKIQGVKSPEQQIGRCFLEFIAPIELNRIQEIGRASCRERV